MGEVFVLGSGVRGEKACPGTAQTQKPGSLNETSVTCGVHSSFELQFLHL